MLTSDQKMDITENVRHLNQNKGETNVIYFILYLYAKYFQNCKTEIIEKKLYFVIKLLIFRI